MDIINSESTYYLLVDFYDDDGNPITPTGFDYTIFDIDTKTEILTEHHIATTTTEYKIEITPAQNTLLDDNKLIETRGVTVKWQWNVNKQGTSEYYYQIKNLKKGLYFI